jgi:hypothetical protein
MKKKKDLDLCTELQTQYNRVIYICKTTDSGVTNSEQPFIKVGRLQTAGWINFYELLRNDDGKHIYCIML